MFLAPVVENVQKAIEHIFPLVYEFRKERSPDDVEGMSKRKQKTRRRNNKYIEEEDTDFSDFSIDEDEEDDDSDVLSCD